jgi:hypothetical protein
LKAKIDQLDELDKVLVKHWIREQFFEINWAKVEDPKG